MSFAKNASKKQQLFETFEANDLDDSFDGTISLLEDNGVPDSPDGPETIIVLRNNRIVGDDRQWTGAVMAGLTKEEAIAKINELLNK